MTSAAMSTRRPRRGSRAVGLFLSVLLGALLVPVAGRAVEHPQAALPDGVTRPDIVVLVIDDLAQIDDRIWERMPTIRRLFLDSGVSFTDVVGNDPLCCPGRANLLTGQWTRHHGVFQNHAAWFDPTTTIATELQGAGYWTGIFGKYFNETHRLESKHPPGWDRSFIFSGAYWKYTAWRNGARLKFGIADDDYSTERSRRAALSALRHAPPDKPRFIWLSPYGVHAGADQQRVMYAPMQPVPHPADAGAVACAGIPAWTTPAYTEADLSDKPAPIGARPAYARFPLVRTCETMLSIDRLLASVLKRLAAQGRPEPMVVLTADNGMAWGAHHWIGKHVPYATPIPLFVHWDALLGTAPARVPTTLSNVDLAPTLCDIAGCEMGPYRNGFGVDGVSFLPVLMDVGDVNRGASPGDRVRRGPVRRTRADRVLGASLGREIVFEEQASGPWLMAPWRGLRTTDAAPIGRWVYTEWETGEVELYDISNGPCWTWQPGDPGDPCQLRNRAGDPDLRELEAALRATLKVQERHPLRIRGLRR